MIWQSLTEILKVHQTAISRNTAPLDSTSKATLTPCERWGHSSVAAHNRMFIVAGYQGN